MTVAILKMLETVSLFFVFFLVAVRHIYVVVDNKNSFSFIFYFTFFEFLYSILYSKFKYSPSGFKSLKFLVVFCEW